MYSSILMRCVLLLLMRGTWRWVGRLSVMNWGDACITAFAFGKRSFGWDGMRRWASGYWTDEEIYFISWSDGGQAEWSPCATHQNNTFYTNFSSLPLRPSNYSTWPWKRIQPLQTWSQQRPLLQILSNKTTKKSSESPFAKPKWNNNYRFQDTQSH